MDYKYVTVQLQILLRFHTTFNSVRPTSAATDRDCWDSSMYCTQYCQPRSDISSIYQYLLTQKFTKNSLRNIFQIRLSYNVYLLLEQ